MWGVKVKNCQQKILEKSTYALLVLFVLSYFSPLTASSQTSLVSFGSVTAALPAVVPSLRGSSSFRFVAQQERDKGLIQRAR